MIVQRVVAGVKKAQADGKHLRPPPARLPAGPPPRVESGRQILGGNQSGNGSAGRHFPQRPAKRLP
jgi:hypothetical protein